MAHHSEEMTGQMEKLVKEMGLGATNSFPMGKLNKNDRGELKLAIGEENGKIVLNFGKPVAWIGFSPEQAMEIALSLMEHSNNCKQTLDNPTR